MDFAKKYKDAQATSPRGKVIWAYEVNMILYQTDEKGELLRKRNTANKPYHFKY